jgi:SAM-dependent methyltransferase
LWIGRHLPALAQRGLSPIGVDLSAAAIARSRRFVSSVPLAQASVDALPFADGAFDLIVAWGVLFHLTTDQLHRALREIRRTLAPQGTAILHALDPSDWRRDPNAGPAHRREIASRHVTGVIDSYYTPEEIAAMLRALRDRDARLVARSTTTARRRVGHRHPEVKSLIVCVKNEAGSICVLLDSVRRSCPPDG